MILGPVRLKRTLNRRVGSKEYHKWVLADVPPEVISALEWEAGEELEAKADRGALLVRRVKAKNL